MPRFGRAGGHHASSLAADKWAPLCRPHRCGSSSPPPVYFWPRPRRAMPVPQAREVSPFHRRELDAQSAGVVMQPSPVRPPPPHRPSFPTQPTLYRGHGHRLAQPWPGIHSGSASEVLPPSNNSGPLGKWGGGRRGGSTREGDLKRCCTAIVYFCWAGGNTPKKRINHRGTRTLVRNTTRTFRQAFDHGGANGALR